MLMCRYDECSHAGAAILKVVYGFDIKSKGDTYLETIEEVVRIFSKILIPGAYLGDSFLVVCGYLRSNILLA